MPIQQMLLGAGGGAVATKTYVDDIFSTFLYKGTGSTQNINNGINLSGEGGLIWTKYRNQAWHHALIDSERGINSVLTSNNDDDASIVNTSPGSMNSFNNNGYSLDTDSAGWVNSNGEELVSWTFRKAPGFFDVVKWDGNNTAGRQISHNLGCVPGCIIVKSYVDSDPRPWRVYHREVDATAPEDYALRLDGNDTRSDNSAFWNDTAPTSSVFTVGNHASTNGHNISYVAYLFAGGESTAATARSVDFDGSNDYLSIPDNDAWDISSSDATIECWVNFDSHNGHDGIIHNLHSSGLPGNGTSAWAFEPVSGTFNFYWGTTAGGYGNVQGAKIPLGQWQHIAVTKSGSTITIYQDGVKTGSGSITGTINSGVVPLNIGGNCVGQYCDCKISNVRIIKGQVLYTSSFKPTYEPLTTTSQGATASNVVLLCCNNSSPTGSTVTPDTITNNNGSTATTDSPFDDPAGFVFGDAEDQNVIKCGSFTTNSDQFAVIDLGYEPQWILIKRTSAADDWIMVDSMRGLPNAQDTEADTGSGTKQLDANTNDTEDGNNRVGITSTGFRFDNYGANASFVYVALRRPDGYVGKPPSLGTDVFAMDTGNASSTIPAFDSGFVVDMAIARRPAITDDWREFDRLRGSRYLEPNNTDQHTSPSTWVHWDSNVGVGTNFTSSYQGWLWKRHAGMDVVTYEGDGVAGREISHSLNKTVDMIWLKSRDSSKDWVVGHKGLNGGTNPWEYHVVLNDTSVESDNTTKGFNDTAPTSTHFTLGSHNAVNQGGYSFIAMLFASVDGISKVGSYTGNGSARSLTFGFQPRFLILRKPGAADDWYVLDTTRGWGSGDDSYLKLNHSQQAYSNADFGAPTSTGWDIPNNFINNSGDEWIYYAHA